MPTILRFCIAGLLLLAFSIESAAQRAGRRRGGSSPVAQPEFILLKITKEAAQTPGKKLQDHINQVKQIIDSEEPVLSAAVPTEDVYLYGPDVLNTEWKLDDIPALSGSDIIIEDTDVPISALDCRETNPVNKQKIADAYPWISADGLRLYFSSSRNVAFSKIHISTRASVEDAFGEPRILSSLVPEGFIGASFTVDELTMIAVKSGDLYISIRNDIHSAFPNPVEVKGIPGNIYHLGPSFSPDGKEIIVTVKHSGDYSIRRYVRTGTYELKEAGKIEVQEKGEPGPGQLSKDGLSYYFSIETKTTEQLWRYTRTALNQPFEKLECINDQLPGWMTSLRNNLQPSVNADGSILVFVTSHGKGWNDDEIGLVNFVKPAKPVITLKEIAAEKTMVEVNVYPNPFTSAVTIDIAALPASGATVNVYDINGKLVKQQRITSTRSEIILDKLPAGIYPYNI
jgi:hypothetical protein